MSSSHFVAEVIQPREAHTAHAEEAFAMTRLSDLYRDKLRENQQYYQTEEVKREAAKLDSYIAEKRANNLASWGVEVPAGDIVTEGGKNFEPSRRTEGELLVKEFDILVRDEIPAAEVAAMRKDQMAGGPVGAVYGARSFTKVHMSEQVLDGDRIVGAANAYWKKGAFKSPAGIELTYKDAAGNTKYEMVSEVNGEWVRLEKTPAGGVLTTEELGLAYDSNLEYARLVSRIEEARTIQAMGERAIEEYALLAEGKTTEDDYMAFAERLADEVRTTANQQLDAISVLKKRLEAFPMADTTQVLAKLDRLASEVPVKAEDTASRIIRKATNRKQSAGGSFEGYKTAFNKSPEDRSGVLLSKEALANNGIKFELSNAEYAVGQLERVASQAQKQSGLEKWRKKLKFL